MDWLIVMTGVQFTGEGVGVQFLASCKPAGEPARQFAFSVPYAYGATNSQKEQAIIAGAVAAYETVFGAPPPAGSRAEILGVTALSKPDEQVAGVRAAIEEAVTTLRSHADLLDSATTLTTQQIRQGIAFNNRKTADLVDYLVAQDVI